MRRLRRSLVGVVLALAGLWLFFRWFESFNLYFPSRAFYGTPRTFNIPYEDVDFTAADGTRLNGWFIPAPDSRSPAPVFLMCHGNGGNISSRIEKIRLLHELGVAAFAFDYRGYGKSEGRPSEKGLYLDGDAAWEYLTKTRGIAPERIVAHGESLGCAVCLEMATRHKFGALIIESGFTSTVDMGLKVFPILPIRLLVRQRFDNAGKLPSVKVPVLVMHSPGDSIIPFAMGKKLFDLANDPKDFVELQGDHNEGFSDSGPIYTNGIRIFLNNAGLPVK